MITEAQSRKGELTAKDLREIRSLSIEQLTSLAYGEHAAKPLFNVPECLAEAAYNELDRREFEW